MDNQLHAAGLIKKPLEDDPVVRRHRLKRREPGVQVGHDEAGRSLAHPGDATKVGPRSVQVVEREKVGKPLAQHRDLLGELGRSSRRLTEPERDGRWSACRVDNPHRSIVDLGNAPRSRSQQKDVAGHRFDRPVLADGAHVGFFVVGDDAPIAEFGNGAAGGHCGEASAPPCSEDRVDLVSVNVRTLFALAGLNTARNERQHFFVAVTGQTTERSRTTNQLEEFVFVPVLGRRLGDDLLRQNVERSFGWDYRIQNTTLDGSEHSDSLDEFVAGGRIHPTDRNAVSAVTGSSDPLQKGGDCPRRADLADQLDGANVDAEFE